MENLDSAVDFIVKNKLIEPGDNVGVGVSGGVDSMALLNFLHSLVKPFGFKLIAVNVNHNLRKSSRKDSAFVSKYCRDNKIEYIGYSVDVAAFAKEAKMSVEQAARVKRYECYEAAAKKFKLNKFALAHHASDQAETILLHIFRGSGIAGASGMHAVRGMYIRPFLETKKVDIIAYNYRNQIPHVEDETNQDNQFARNFIRNQIIPTLQTEWRNVEKNIVDFGRNCRSDDEYLNSLLNLGSLLGDENHVRIPLNFFAYPYAVSSRIAMAALERIGARENIEKKHVDAIVMLAKKGENGNRADLPNGLFAVREYEYIAVVRKITPVAMKIYSFKIGRTNFSEYGTIIVSKTISYKEPLARGLMVVDVDKLPKTAKWRIRKDGDVFTKFGGGTKSLASYMIDQKIPARLRNKIPVLAVGSEIYAVGALGAFKGEISEKVRTERGQTLEAYVLEFVKD